MSEITLENSLFDNANRHPDTVVYRYVEDGENEIYELTLSQLYRNAQSIASYLIKNGKQGDRVLLLFPPGLDFCNALWACFISGFVAVPVPLSANINSVKSYLDHLQLDCNAEFLLTNTAILPLVEYQKAQDPEMALPEIIACADELLDKDTDNFDRQKININDIAMLQYTSGSVSKPKGVILTHENIIENLYAIQRTTNVFDMKEGVCWLPHFHDMGLIGNFLIVVVSPNPGPLTFISPLIFIEKPLRWLKLMNRLKGEISVAPNFAFELCTKAIDEKDLEGFDFSNWKIALCGSEPIKNNVIEAFLSRYEKYGFRRGAIVPCYGLAEATLLVTSKSIGEQYRVLKLNKEELKHHRIVDADKDHIEIVSCGKADQVVDVKIIDKESDKELGENEIGEILISGKCISQGYWNKSDEINEIFKTKIEGSDKNYFKTGDLGFLRDEELYVTGRIKDLIIIRGKNYYPQDIETTIYNIDKHVRKGCVTAFSIEENEEEKLVVICEIKRSVENPDFESIVKNIKRIIRANFGISAKEVFIIKPNTIPKTTSGKLKRSKSKELVLSGKLKFLHHDKEYIEENKTNDNIELINYIKEEIALIAKLDIQDIDESTSLFDLGIESIHLPLLLDKLKKKTNKRLIIENWITIPTIENLVIQLNKAEEASIEKPRLRIKAKDKINAESKTSGNIIMPDFTIIDNKE